MIEDNRQDAPSETPGGEENVDFATADVENNADDASNVQAAPDVQADAESQVAGADADERKSATLEEALEKYNIQLPAKKVRLLKEYCELLWTWNERINLTRHDDFDKFVSRDLVDSTRLAECFQKGEHALDVGSGGGVPGLVLAILRPDVVVELCESTGKKAEALGAMVDALGLDLNVWYAKAEDLLKVHHFHTLTIRAVGKIHKLLSTFAPVWRSFDRILMIKGPNWADERGEARHYNALLNIALRKVDEYENPGAEHGSVILQFCRKSRFAEIEQRAKDRAEGKPIEREIEPVEVDNRPRDLAERESGRGRGGERRGRFSRDGARPARPARPFVAAKNRRGDDAESTGADAERKPFERPRDENEVRVFARKNGKPPKGWTGKKREFRAESSVETPDGDRSRPSEKRFGAPRSGAASGGSRFGGDKRGGANGKFSSKRSQGRPGGGSRPERGGGRGGKNRGAE